MTLEQKLKRSLSLSFLDKYIGYFLRFLASLFIARLCTPNDIGVFSVAFVMINMGHLLRDFGVGQYLVQQAVIDKQKVRASFTVMLLFAWSLFGLLWVIKKPLAAFYRHPELEHAIEILSCIYLLAPFGSVRTALLRRNMDFKKLAKINIASYSTLHVSAVYLAWQGLGYQALVWAQVLGVSVLLIGTLIVSPPLAWQWPSFRGTKAVLRFGWPVCLGNLVETSSESAADLILGRTLSMQAVAFIGRAHGLMNLFKVGVTSAIWPVVLPYFSEKNRQGECVLKEYLKGLELFALFAFPFYVGLFFFAYPITMLLFGEQWLPSVPLIQVLSGAALFQSIFPFLAPLFVAKGEVKAHFNIQVARSLLRIGFIGAGACFDLLTVAQLWLLSEALGAWVVYKGIQKSFGLRLEQLYSHLQLPFTLVILLSIVFTGIKATELTEYQMLGVAVLSGIVVWVGLLKRAKHVILNSLMPSALRSVEL